MPHGENERRPGVRIPKSLLRIVRSRTRARLLISGVFFLFLAAVPLALTRSTPPHAHIALLSDGLAYGFPQGVFSDDVDSPHDGGSTSPSQSPAPTGGGNVTDVQTDVGPEPSLIELPAGAAATFLDRTRVLAPPAGASPAHVAAAQAAADEANEWLDAGTIPGVGTQYEAMARTALLDLRALAGTEGAMRAGPHRKWSYAWPRDNSFAAAAFAQTGHEPEAIAILEFLERVQSEDGSFHARYLLDGSGPPDDRAPQTDGTGWALWALDQVVTAAAPGERAALVGRFSVLLDRSTTHILHAIDNPDSLPSPSPDYWEVREKKLTLGTAAPLLAGLESAARLYRSSDIGAAGTETGTAAAGHAQGGEAAESAAAAAAAAAADIVPKTQVNAAERAHAADDGATRLRTAIERTFGAKGFPRHISGGAPDAASAFVLPPFVGEPLVGAAEAWEASIAAMTRPAGGLAPGGSWKQDGISWTPETALYALSAAHQGDSERAEGWLTWLDEHRTGSGALPEKVLADGSPAAVAPLAWTGATVLLTLEALRQSR